MDRGEREQSNETAEGKAGGSDGQNKSRHPRGDPSRRRRRQYNESTISRATWKFKPLAAMPKTGYFARLSHSQTPKNGVELLCSDISRSVGPTSVAKYRCNCRYPWLRELHGLTALMMSNSLWQKIVWAAVIGVAAGVSIANTSYIMSLYSNHQTATLIIYKPVRRLVYPTLVFCPKYADALNYPVLWQDMGRYLGDIPIRVRSDLIAYIIAGSGFDNVDLSPYNQTYLQQLDVLYQKWRGERTVLDMFKFIFDENGVRCPWLFKTCWSGSADIDCCTLFEPTFVMLRGRCFRLKYPYYQEDVDETDKLQLTFGNPISPILGAQQKRAQLVVYIGDENPEVGLYPRYYLGANDWNRLRMVQKKISMLPESGRCSEDPISRGKSTCFVRRWIENVIDPLNCTLPYFSELLYYMAQTPVCPPDVVVSHYNNVTSPLLSNYHCQPACQRVENDIQITSTADASVNPNYSFRIEISFNELEYEQYDEVRQTSLAGFISELGGQSGLFVGCSVITFIQLGQSIVFFLARIISNAYRKYLSIPISLKIDDIFKNKP